MKEETVEVLVTAGLLTLLALVVFGFGVAVGWNGCKAGYERKQLEAKP